ncbi:hypothetical protein BDN72DRAFT_15024 [Pluteus cervinus]|uniref:Uncharacterized protein n=1 Tax=Pluteus cervinus TaxID=181527 RepID=A0ACD3BIG8_9AGAR|nr:hypothetical protein BDN72DRAFT_15024 [Pluteus cervinus]
MLKRQRPSSPPPFVNQSVPAPLEPPDIEIPARKVIKRRRVLPPVLDGSLRGWGDHPQPPPSDDEEWDDAEVAGPSIPPEELTAYAKDYEATNKLLRDLHVSHQHHEHVYRTKPPFIHATVAQPHDNPAGSATTPSTDDIYEDANRSLREAFLNRRRVLDSSPPT